MKLDELMSSLQTIELNLKQDNKEKSIALQVEKQESSNECNSKDDESFVLLTKNFNKFMKRMNRKRFLKAQKDPIAFRIAKNT